MNTQQLSAKDYLSQAYLLDKLIDGKIEQARSLRALATKATVTLSDMPPGGSRNVHRMEDIIARMVDLESEINADIDNLLTLKKDIDTTIKCVSNPEYRVLLELRYLCFKSWRDVAVTMNYGRKYIFRVHDRALEQVRIPEKEDTKIT